MGEHNYQCANMHTCVLTHTNLCRHIYTLSYTDIHVYAHQHTQIYAHRCTHTQPTNITQDFPPLTWQQYKCYNETVTLFIHNTNIIDSCWIHGSVNHRLVATNVSLITMSATTVVHKNADMMSPMNLQISKKAAFNEPCVQWHKVNIVILCVKES